MQKLNHYKKNETLWIHILNKTDASLSWWENQLKLGDIKILINEIVHSIKKIHSSLTNGIDWRMITIYIANNESQ